MQYYRSKLVLFTMLCNKYKEIDFNATMNYKHHFTFVMKGESPCQVMSAPDFFQAINDKTGCNIDTEKSVRVGTRGYGLYYNSEAKVQVVEDVVQEDDKPEVDWDKVEAFKNKDDLEKYGLTFGIDLNKRKSLSNMVKELKEALAK